jgi:hypothetical protein
MVVATLRSRGVTNYSSTQHGPLFQVTGTTDVTIDCSGGYSAVTKNPYETFVISGITKDGNTFSFETSLTTTDSEYISKVFGRSNFGKDRTEVPLFVEESYSSLLQTGYRDGKIRGLYCDLVALPKRGELSLIDQLGVFYAPAGAALRATFIVDPEGVIQHVTVNNLNVGRSPEETLRVLDSLQTGELCACNRAIGGETL